MVRHDELMDSILMEEEALVTFHRGRLEEDMEMLRQEMGILGVSVREGVRVQTNSVKFFFVFWDENLANVAETQILRKPNQGRWLKVFLRDLI